MPGHFSLQQISFFIILAIAIFLFLTERIRNDLVAVMIVVALYATGILKASEALAGFSSEPAIVVAGIFVLSEALHQTGLSDTIGDWIGRLAGKSYTGVIAVIMPSVALLSAFTHHVTTTAVMLPVTLKLSGERNIPASKLLMPVSFAASLGTTITIIGAPAFLIASSVLQQSGRPGLSIFSIAPVGLSLSLVGTIFMLLVGRFLLPSREGGEEQANHFRLEEYLTEITILKDSPFLDKDISEIEKDERYHFNVVGLMRNKRRKRPPFKNEKLREGDVLIVRTTPEEIVAFRQEAGVELHPISKYGEPKTNGNGNNEEEHGEDLFVQAVVAPGSDLVNRTLSNIDFRRRYGVLVVSIWRKRGWLSEEMAKIKLRAGDVLVLEGDEEGLARVASDNSFLMIVPFHGEARLRSKAPLAGLIMLATILLAAFNVMTIEMAALAGAAVVVLTNCLTPRQAYRAIDSRIFVFIAGAIPLGAAIQKSGTAQLIAGWLQYAIGGLHETLILLILFAVVAVITQFMSDAATTALFAPVAVALAQGLGHPPEAYVVTVAMSAVAAFLTPIGHHGNLLVYGPGRYHFADFVRVGTPLTILVALVVAILSPIIWH